MKLICTSDWHLRPDKPPCRRETQDEWVQTQIDKVSFILNFSRECNADILIAGDICHRATGWPSWFFSKIITLLSGHSQRIICCAGQHDMPYHQKELLNNSNLGVLIAARAVSCHDREWLNIFSWGDTISCEKKALIALTHMMILKSENDELWPGQIEKTKAGTAERILKENSCFRLIVTGDNHQPFSYRIKNRFLVNAGSLTRQRSNETHSPGFYFYDDGDEDVKRIEIPHKKTNVLSNEEERSEEIANGTFRISDNFIDEMGNGVKLNYFDALQDYFDKRNTSAKVQKRILGETYNE